MRNVLITLVAACAIAAASGAGAARADNGADWLVAGTGTTVVDAPYVAAMVHVNAQSGFGGASVRGHFWLRFTDGSGEFGGEIVCLSVAGKAAALYGQIERVKTPRASFTVGSYVPIRLFDGGDPGTTFDLVNFDPGQAAPPAPDCLQNQGYVPISQGNYVVHDQPLADVLGFAQLLSQFEAAADDPYGG